MRFFVFIGMVWICLQGHAQQKTIAVEDLPKVISEGFALAYPDLPQCTWEQRSTRFVATIEYDDHVEYATFLENGDWAETRSDVERSELPEKTIEYTESRYDAYQIQSIQYVEENGGGIYYALSLALKSNKSLTTELIFDLTGNIMVIDGLPVEENLGESVVVKDNSDALLRPGIQKEIIDENEGIPDIVLQNLTKRYGVIEKIKWTKTDLGFHRAEYEFREESMASEWDDEGNQASTIRFFTKKTAVYSIQRLLDENYSRATFIHGERVVYETRFTRMFPEKGLKSYFEVVVSDRKRGEKTPLLYTIYFDNSGQLDMIVERTPPPDQE